MGGKLIKDVKVSPIPQDYIRPTLRKLEELILKPLNINSIQPVEDRLMGSALLKDEPSGDLDLIIDKNEIVNIDTFKKELDSLLSGFNLASTKTSFSISIPFPQYDIDEEITNEWVQVDFFIEDYEGLSNIHRKRRSKRINSAYEPLDYLILLHAILRALSFKVEDPEGTTFTHYNVQHYAGIFKVKKTLISPKTGKELKKPTIIEREKVAGLTDKDILDTINSISKVKAKEEDIQTVESLIKWTQKLDYEYKIKIKEFLKEYYGEIPYEI